MREGGRVGRSTSKRGPGGREGGRQKRREGEGEVVGGSVRGRGRESASERERGRGRKIQALKACQKSCQHNLKATLAALTVPACKSMSTSLAAACQ
jgi:hypothetical protein